jgi:hypothetical protein
MSQYDTAQYSFSEDGFQRMKKDLDYIMRNLDHRNVKRLYTEFCDVQSAAGETVIDGPLIKQYASGSTTLRLKEGYNPASSAFEFALYNSTGVQTVGIDSSGNVDVTGTITGSEIIAGTITGSTISGGYIYGSTIAGGTLTVGTSNIVKISEDADNGQIQFIYSDGTTACRMYFSSSFWALGGQSVIINPNSLWIWPSSELHINADNIMVIPDGGKFYYGGPSSTNEVATRGWVTGRGYITGTAGETGSFTIGTATVTVSDGLVTSITT